MSKITFEIKETIAVLSQGAKGWQKELNLISWNGRAPKYDIRDWSADHTKMGKGITLSDEEMRILLNAFSSEDKSDSKNDNNQSRENKIDDWIKSFKQQSPIFFTELRNLLIFTTENGLAHSYICKVITEEPLSNEDLSYNGDKDLETLQNQLNNELHMMKMIYDEFYEEFSGFLKENDPNEYTIICKMIIDMDE